MRVLGIDIQGADVIAIIVDGTRTDGVIEKIEPTRLSFPQIGPDEADNLLLFENQLVAVISQAKPDCVAIIKAVGGMYSSSPIKVKIECLVQLAAKRNNVRCELLTSQSVSKAQKTTAKDGENLKMAIEGLDPKYAQRAAYCAWGVLCANA
jgi:Protein of unknown function (DUF3010)